MEAAPEETSSLLIIWVDAGFSGENFPRVMAQVVSAKVEVVRRSQPDFPVLPKRWIVERTFAWWNQYRRLSKDYELLLLYYQNFGSQFTLTSAAKSQAISARRISSTSAGTNA